MNEAPPFTAFSLPTAVLTGLIAVTAGVETVGAAIGTDATLPDRWSPGKASK